MVPFVGDDVALDTLKRFAAAWLLRAFRDAQGSDSEAIEWLGSEQAKLLVVCLGLDERKFFNEVKKMENTKEKLLPDVPEEIREAIEHGESLIYVRAAPLKYDGHIYSEGDKISIGNGAYDKKLIDAGWFVTPARFAAEQQRVEKRKYKRDFVEPTKSLANHAATDERKAEKELAAAQAALKSAQDRLELARGRREKADSELAQVVEAAPSK